MFLTSIKRISNWYCYLLKRRATALLFCFTMGCGEFEERVAGIWFSRCYRQKLLDLYEGVDV